MWNNRLFLVVGRKNVANHDGGDWGGVGIDVEVFDVDGDGGVVGARFSVWDVDNQCVRVVFDGIFSVCAG